MSDPITLRLRTPTVDEYVQLAAPWYADPEVLHFSEDDASPYGPDMLRAMYETLTQKGELYVVELLEAERWCPIGDAALLPDAIPIVIGVPAARSRGIGTKVLALLIDRARELGWRELNVDAIVPSNLRALQLYRRAGFQSLGETGGRIRMRKALD